MRGRLPFVSVLLALGFGLAGCATLSASGAQPLRAEQVYSAIQCGSDDKSARAAWIADQAAWRQLSAKLHPAPEVGVDFDREGLLLVEMGERATAGYGVDLAAPEVEVRAGTAWVRTRWTMPAPGTINAQVITSPCVVIKLPKGDFDAIRVVDQNDKQRARIAVR